jgi:K+-sensing histidine kinase KdpD
VAKAYDLPMPMVLRLAIVKFAVVAGSSLATASVAAGVLQDYLDVENPSAVYLVAVVATAIASGTWGSVFAAVGAFLLYNFLFVEPRYTFTVAQPGELVNLLLLLFVGIVVGQLVALQRSRTEVARAREREARSLFQISRELATRNSTPTELPTIAGILRRETAMERIWIALGPDDARERVAADTGTEQQPVKPGIHQQRSRAPRSTSVSRTRCS